MNYYQSETSQPIWSFQILLGYQWILFEYNSASINWELVNKWSGLWLSWVDRSKPVGYNFEPHISNFQISFSTKLSFNALLVFNHETLKRDGFHVYWFNTRNQQQASLTLKPFIIYDSSENQQCIDHKTTWIFCLRTFLNFCGQLLLKIIQHTYNVDIIRRKASDCIDCTMMTSIYNYYSLVLETFGKCYLQYSLETQNKKKHFAIVL